MKAYERFLNYVGINTESNPESNTTPSTDCQMDLARILKDELKALGASDIELTEKGYLYAKYPASKGCENAPAIGLLAHMDTAPAFSGKGVSPILHKNYNGEDIVLPKGGKVIKASNFPFLQQMKGKTIITADGSTLLGADDKAGIAEILTLCERVQKGEVTHGTLCIGFTPDEEVGAGADYFDVARFGAQFAYTMDGDAVGCIEYENFNSAGAEIIINGVSVHPGSAKDIMVNAVLLAMEIQSKLPQDALPEKTSGYEGFFFLDSIKGDAAATKMEYIIRDHDREKFEEKKTLLKQAVKSVQETHPTAEIILNMQDSYFNMREKIEPCMHLIDNAKKAAQLCNITPKVKAIRGGTDGSRLSYMGLPCPNLGTGGQNFHGPYELIAAEDMDKAVEMLVKIVEIYAE